MSYRRKNKEKNPHTPPLNHCLSCSWRSFLAFTTFRQILAECLSGCFLKISKRCSGDGREANTSLKTLQKLPTQEPQWQRHALKYRLGVCICSCLLLATLAELPCLQLLIHITVSGRFAGDQCNCLCIQSCATELDGVIPDVYQRCNRDQTLAFSNGNHTPPLAQRLPSLHPFWKRILCVCPPLQQCIWKKEPVDVVQLVDWYYLLFSCALLLFFPSGHVHLRKRWHFYHHIHPVDVTGTWWKKSLKKSVWAWWHLQGRHWQRSL